MLLIELQVGPLWGTYKTEETFAVIQTLIEKAQEAHIPIFYIQYEGIPGDMMANGSMF